MELRQIQSWINANASFTDDLQDVATPVSLFDECISKIDSDLSTKKILVLYNIEAVYLLIKNYKVKLQNIYFFTQSNKKNSSLKQIGINVFYTNIKNDPIQYLNSVNMKFDVVIGNPPFEKGKGAKNTKLWMTFSKLAIKLSNKYVSFITPNNILSDKGVNGNKLRQYIKDNNFGFIDIKDHKDIVFKGYGVSTCNWTIKIGSKDIVDPIIIKNKINLNNIDNSIIDKVINYNAKLELKMYNGHISKEMLSETGKEIYFSGDKLKYTNNDIIDDKKLKVVFPFSCSYKKMFITDKPLGMLNLAVNIKNKEEGAVIISYANSKLFNFVSNKYKKTSGFTPFVKGNKIPDLIRDEIWTDQQLYKHFKLTDEEIDYIESTIK
jgi:hypothetical protein